MQCEMCSRGVCENAIEKQNEDQAIAEAINQALQNLADNISTTAGTTSAIIHILSLRSQAEPPTQIKFKHFKVVELGNNLSDLFGGNRKTSLASGRMALVILY